MEEDRKKKPDTMRRVLSFIGSMKFAIVLLAVLAAACAAGSFLTQGLTYEEYAGLYSENAAHLIMLLGLNDVFHSVWFLILTALLCLSLLLCNILRMPRLVRASHRQFSPEAALKVAQASQSAAPEKAEKKRALQIARLQSADEGAVRQLLKKASFGRTVSGRDEAGHSYLYADRHKAGLWGPWLTHLGILVLIVGFGLGQMLKAQYTVYGLPGESMAVSGTDLIVTIDNFEINKDETGNITQYTSSLTVHNAADGTTRSGQTSVNHPVTLYGLKFYQNSTGWAGHITVKENDEQIQEETMCIPGTISLAGHENLHLSLLAFYPQYDPAATANDTSSNLTVTNPGWLYQVSADGQVIGMNVLCDDYISIDVADDKTLTIDIDDPQIFTLISVKKEPFTWLALLGALIIMAGLVLSFYVQPQQIIARQDADGLWHIYGWSRKGGLLYKQRLEQIAGKCG